MARPTHRLEICVGCGVPKRGCVLFKALSAGRGAYICKACAPAYRVKSATFFGLMGVCRLLGLPTDGVIYDEPAPDFVEHP